MTNGAYLAGTSTQNSGVSVTQTFTLSSNVSQGDSLVLALCNSSTGATVSAVQDTQNGPWTAAGATSAFDSTEANASGGTWVLDNSIPMTSGVDQITITWSSSTGNQGAILVGVGNVNGLDQGTGGSTPNIKQAHSSGSTSPSVTSFTLSQNEAYPVAIIVDAQAGGVPTWANGYSNITSIDVNSVIRMHVAQRTVTAGGTTTASATITSAAWTATVVCEDVAAVAYNNNNSLSSGIVGLAYSQTIEGTGGITPYTYSITSGSLPPGLGLAGAVISGTPTTPGTYTFTATITDTNGVVGSQDQSVVIAAAGATGAVTQLAPNNLITAFDSNFEAPGFTWAADVNASAPVRSGVTALTGLQALYWTSSADGDSSIATGFYPVVPNKGYVVGAQMMPLGQRSVVCGVYWYDHNHTIIGSANLGNAGSTSAAEWQSVQALLTSPGTASFMKVIAKNIGTNKGDGCFLDQVSVVEAAVAIAIDFVNEPFVPAGAGTVAGNDFMDLTPWVRLDQDITIQRGRQDGISEVQSGSLSFTIQNDSGLFTRFRTDSFIPFLGGNDGGGDFTLQRRCQLNETDENGVWYTRFDGPIQSVNYNFDLPGLTATAVVVAADVLTPLTRQDQLNCWTKQTVLTDAPILHWTLDDDGGEGGSGLAAETSGNNGPPLRLSNSDSTNVATISWQDSSGGVETLANAVAPGQPDGSEFWSPGNSTPSSTVRGLDSGTFGPFSTPLDSPLFTPTQTAQSTQNTFIGSTGWMLSNQLGPNFINPTQTAQDYSFECWFMMDGSIATNLASKWGPMIALSLGNSRNKHAVIAGLYLGGSLSMEVQYWNQPPAWLNLNWPSKPNPSPISTISTSITADTNKLPHHLVITISGDPTNATLNAYLDTVNIGSLQLNTAQTFDTLCVGGAFGGTGAWNGNIQLVSVYDYALTSTQIQQHCMMGQYGMWEQTTDNIIQQLGVFANIPSFWNNLASNSNGLTLCEYQDITNTNALNNMQIFEAGEAGLLYVQANGQLAFQTRDQRMGKAGVDLYFPQDTFDNTGGLQLIDQFQNNEASLSTSAFTGTTSINVDSQNKYGDYNIEINVQVPLITWNRAYAQLGLPSFNFWSDPNIDDLSQWLANSRADPFLLPPSLTFDLLTLDAQAGIKKSDMLKLDVGSVIAVKGSMPANLPNGELNGAYLNQNYDFESGVSPWTTANAATLVQSGNWALKGTHSAQFNGNGSTANPSIVSETTVPVTAGQTYTAAGTFYSVIGWNAMQVNIEWRKSDGTVASTVTGASVNVPASYPQGTPIATTAVAPANAVAMDIKLTISGTPASNVQMLCDIVTVNQGTLQSNGAGSPLRLEWFIEGINEDINMNQRQLTLYLSPATQQRAWIPGDITYGVPGVTTMLGLTANDPDQVPADGKDVSHDAGPPYWPPQFSGTMNSPANQNAPSSNPDFQWHGNGATAFPGITSQDFPVLPSTEYTAGAWLSNSDGTWMSGSGSQGCYVQFEWKDSSHTHISYSTPTVAGNVTNQAQLFTLQQTSPSNAAYAALLLVANNTPPSTASFQAWYARPQGLPQAVQEAPIADNTTGWTTIANATITTKSGTWDDTDGGGFIGSGDLRGINYCLSNILQPPMCVVGAQLEIQTFASGQLSNPTMLFDQLYVDTEGGMGLLPGFPNWYVVTVPGWYEIDVAMPWADNQSGDASYTGEAWIVVAYEGVQINQTNLGNPLTNLKYVCPVGESQRWTNNGSNPVCSPTARMYLGIGDMIAVAASQNRGSSHDTGIGTGGMYMSICWTGLGTVDDRTEVNTTINGGAVTTPVFPTQHTKTYNCTQTYQYGGLYGTSGRSSTKDTLPRISVGGQMRCGYNHLVSGNGDQFSFAKMPQSTMHSDMTGATLVSATLTMTQVSSVDGNGANVLIGTGGPQVIGNSSITSSAYGTYTKSGQASHQFAKADKNVAKTFTIPTSLVAQIINGSRNSFMFGDRGNGASNNSGSYTGGPNSVILTVTYKI